jgi:ParB family chromosome partitioning protein
VKKTTERPYKTSLTDKVDLLFQGQMPEVNHLSLLPLTAIQLSTFQPRAYFDPQKIEELAQTIRIHGILEPLLVRQQENGYELIAGGRRYLAAQSIGLQEVPVIILTLSDQECLEVAILENFQREDLNPIEETEAVLQLLASRLQLEPSQVISRLYRLRNQQLGKSRRNVSTNDDLATVEAIFAPLGMSWKSFVETRLPLLKLPEDILQCLRQGRIEYTKAKAIATVKDAKRREQLLEQAITEEMSLSQIRQSIAVLDDLKEATINPQQEIQVLSQQLKKAQLWKTNPKKWRRVQSLLAKLKALIEEEAGN